jgi:hypothetical protein
MLAELKQMTAKIAEPFKSVTFRKHILEPWNWYRVVDQRIHDRSSFAFAMQPTSSQRSRQSQVENNPWLMRLQSTAARGSSEAYARSGLQIKSQKRRTPGNCCLSLHSSRMGLRKLNHEGLFCGSASNQAAVMRQLHRHMNIDLPCCRSIYF